MNIMHKPYLDTKVRLDKWLWAARFFKTRNLAKQAIEGGKVQCDGQRVKAAKEISVGITLAIRQDLDEAPGFVSAAFTNPVFVDVDGNGRFDPPGL